MQVTSAEVLFDSAQATHGRASWCAHLFAKRAWLSLEPLTVKLPMATILTRLDTIARKTAQENLRAYI
jgi:hypothetical protein